MNPPAIDAALRPDNALESVGCWTLHPAPTIIEAARALYAGHEVAELARSDAGATNSITTARLEDINDTGMAARRFVLLPEFQVLGTLVAIATQHFDPNSDLYQLAMARW